MCCRSSAVQAVVNYLITPGRPAPAANGTTPVYGMLFVREGVAVKTHTYAETRARLAAILNVVADNREEVIVSRPGKEDVVILALGDYESMRETAYLLGSPANARRLWWQAQDRKILKRINLLIADIARDDNTGIGKPEPLRHTLQGFWSRRSTDEHQSRLSSGRGRGSHCILPVSLPAVTISRDRVEVGRTSGVADPVVARFDLLGRVGSGGGVGFTVRVR
jgi:toxin YoeB